MKLIDYKKQYNQLTTKKNLSGAKALEAVKQNGSALIYVKEQTEEISLAAVKQDGYALKYVKEQTEEICLAAVKQNGYVLAYVKEQTEEICLEAVKQNDNALQYVDSKFFIEDNSIENILSKLDKDDTEYLIKLLKGK